jgi:asparagine synthase (glutamine-hydrolysing)
MCGIAASLHLDDVSVAPRGWAIPFMRHRGPDGEGVLSGLPGQPSLEHCRLAIIDPDNRESDQPFSDPSGRWTIAYNGELFNYRELRRDLIDRGARFRTDSDTEVVLNALVLDGPEALKRFRGMFALLLWDAESRILLAARDQIGVKPLYYTVSRGTFVAASELRTLIAHPAVRPELDPASVVEYLSFGFVAGAGTLLDGVHKLEPGHFLLVEHGSVRTAEYWDVLLAGRTSTPVERRDQLEELRDALDTAVSGALVSDVPVSLMLSGGLDSSAIAALATRHVSSADLTAYSVSFGLPTDESKVAARLAGDLGIRHREILLTRGSLAEGFDQWIVDMDLPSANPTWIAVSSIAAAVAGDGNKVLLGGDGADELFGGYNRWMTYLRFHDRYWSRIPAAGRRVIGSGARPFARGLAGDIGRRAREGGQLFVGSRPFHDDDLRRCLGPVAREAARQSAPEAHVDALRKRFDTRRPGGDQLAWMSYVALKTDLVEDYLVRLDTMGMRHSVEGRVPLLDVDLVELAFSLSQKEKVGPHYEQKALYRQAVSSFLPTYVTDRPKQGFCPPVAEWASSLLRTRAGSPSQLIDCGLIAPRAVEALAGSKSVKASFSLWALGTLSVWCDTNLS